MDLEKLEKLNQLRQEGALTQEEFEREKQKVIGESAGCPTKEMIMGLSPYEYAAVINFAWFFPYIGWIGSLIFWLLGRNKSEVVDTQGKYFVNWFITWTLVGFVLIVALVFSSIATQPFVKAVGVIVSIGLFICMILCGLAFPAIAGFKCIKGATWRYPLSITFIK